MITNWRANKNFERTLIRFNFEKHEACNYTVILFGTCYDMLFSKCSDKRKEQNIEIFSGSISVVKMSKNSTFKL